MDKKATLKDTILIIIILVSFIIIGIQAIKIKELNEKRFSLVPGETLPAIELINQDNKPLNSSVFSQGITVLLCFKVPCTSCNTNVSSWNNLVDYFGARIKVVGIIPDADPAGFRLLEEKKINFSLYLPVDKNSFSRKMHLNNNMAQTIVVFRNKVKLIKIGTLSMEDLKTVKSFIKELVIST
jgi:peroxiredoxin